MRLYSNFLEAQLACFYFMFSFSSLTSGQFAQCKELDRGKILSHLFRHFPDSVMSRAVGTKFILEGWNKVLIG